jgi:hypothetical protein
MRTVTSLDKKPTRARLFPQSQPSVEETMRTNVAIKQPQPVTFEGTPAARLTPTRRLRRSIMACLLWEGEFYEDGEAIVARILALVPLVPARAVVAIAIEAREDMKLRHVPLLLAAALAILLREICSEVAVYAFNHDAYDVAPRRGFALRDALASTKGSYSCGGMAVTAANLDGYDRIIVLTDGEWHNMESTRVGRAQTMCPPPLTERAYMVNVSSYENVVEHGRWHGIDGWSEKIIDYIRAIERPDHEQP